MQVQERWWQKLEKWWGLSCDLTIFDGMPIEIISKIILRHADLSTTQRYLGKGFDYEAIRWIENLNG